MTRHPLSLRIGHVLGLRPEGNAVEFDDRWTTWGELAEDAQRIAATVGHRQAGILLRNTPRHIAALLGVLIGGGTVVVINPAHSDARVAAEIDDLQVVIGAGDDLLDVRDTDALAVERPGVAVRMLTSGTTGPPKRIDLTYDMLARSVLGADFDTTVAPTEPRRGVAIVNAPLVHIGGVYRVLQCVCEARPFALLDRFRLERWAAAVRRHRPKAVSLVPAALRTVLHSDLTRADLDGIRVVTSGTAPLSADDADAFTEKFGIPVLTSYAATEFGGGVAGWTLSDHETYWKAKRGSVGRASLGARLRVVDDDGTVLGSDEPGLLEVKPGQLGPSAEWMRTTDMARIDADGFVWILGRADQAIIRGGFKVMPDDVRAALESHPAVEGAAVTARPDERLGETPVAMVELRDAATDVAALLDHLRKRLMPYEIPTDIAIVDEIPRTPSGKADLTAVRRHLFEHRRACRR